MKQTDSVKPYITQKDVILCRSGIQLYSYSEVVKSLGEPPVKKDFYREYRPANVVVKAQDLCRSLPVTKEHPDVFVDADNFNLLTGGTLDKEVSVVALEGESEGEIGIKSNVTFYSRDLYEYYQQNKEVSLGYTCRKHFVDNPDEVGYDIILDEILDVNHLAITRAGRGGSSVAVIDSIIGGLKPMRTGIFAWLAGNKQKNAEPSSFGKTVLDSIKNTKGNTEEELAKGMKGVLDSLSVMKDCEAKDTLLDVVKDCFDNREKALSEEVELTKSLDSMWEKLQKDSVKDFEEEKSEDSEEKKDDEKAEDSEEKKEDEAEKSEDSEEEKKDDEKEKSEDSEEEKKDDEKTEDSEKKDEEDGCHTKDSMPVMTKDDILTLMKESLKPMVEEAVKSVLNIKDSATAQADGGVLDSRTNVSDSNRDYSSFID